MKHVYQVFEKCRKKHDRNYKSETIGFAVLYTFKHKFNKIYQGDLEQRLNRQMKYSMNVLSTVKKDQYEEDGIDVLRKFLFQTALNLETKDSFEHVNHIRYKIARMYRDHIEALRLRADTLS